MFKRFFPIFCGAITIFALLPVATPQAATGDCQLFPETSKKICGRFLAHWEEHGGLAQQGYPISNEFREVSDVDGKSYNVQYFERAVFEYHPENQPPFDVLLSQLGTFRYRDKYQRPTPTVVVAPSATS